MGSNENFQGVNVIRPSDVVQGGGKRLAGVGNNNNRRALSAIDENIIGDPPHHCPVNKRGLSTRENENAACNKNPVAPIHRPVTRRFAAQLAGKQTTQEAQPPIQPVSTAHHDDDTPMYVHHTEAMLEEIDRMETEVEMDDMDEDEAIVDIDIGDQNNPLAVSEYIDDLYTYYKKMESLSCVPPNYMVHQFDINERMRAILIDWLIEVHYKFELMEETLYLTVNIIDRFLAAHSVVRKKLQLVGITSLLLACKYEEVSVPVIEDLILITDKAYCTKEVLNMEKLIVNTLQFNMSLPTPYVFMRRFLKAAQSDKRMELLAFYIIELCLVEYEMLHFPPSLLAAAAVFTAQCTITGRMQWSKTCEKHTGYTQDELLECAKLMVSFHEKAGSGKLTGVYKKYSTSKHGYVAKVGAASTVFLSTDK